jgi:hypothetical protein
LYVVAVAGATGATGASRTSSAIPAFDARVSVQVPADDADALYKDRENLASARRATGMWEARVKANAQDFDAAYKLSQARYWLGTNGLPESERKMALEAGIAAARTAIAINAARPEGHFWLAANMGALAESFGLRQGIKYRGQIKDALLATLKIDPGFLQGSADRALGRWYFKVPRLFGGSNKRSEEHLRKSLTYNPNSVITHLFLADTLADDGRNAEARAEYQAAIDAPFDPDWTPEDRRFKEQAKRQLPQLRR